MSDRLGRHRADAAIAQEAIDRRNVAERSDPCLHDASSGSYVKAATAFNTNADRARKPITNDTPCGSSRGQCCRISAADQRRAVVARPRPGRRCAMTRFVALHLLDDRARALIARRQSLQVRLEMLDRPAARSRPRIRGCCGRPPGPRARRSAKDPAYQSGFSRLVRLPSSLHAALAPGEMIGFFAAAASRASRTLASRAVRAWPW